ncbi:hypothetical protein, partial [Pseudomonas sp. SIMBA_067]|uniref:hypothetical protein n=1 Tax=Pseudomonas sp. SIMBA_067 TaxID=3085807 RepID=UPI003979DC8D
MTDNVIVGHAGCGVNALSDLRFYPCVGLIRRASVASDINKAHFSNNLWGGYRRFISGAYPLHQPLS